MSHRKIVAKVRDFLITELQESLIRKYAEQELQGIRDTTAQGKKRITKDEINEYIQQHYSDLKRKSEQDLEDTARQLVAEHRFLEVLKDLGALSLILVPPMYPLVRHMLTLMNEHPEDLTEISACVISLFLLALPIIGYFRSLFRE